MKDKKSSNGRSPLTYTMLVRLPNGHFENQPMLEIFPELTPEETLILGTGRIGTMAHLRVRTGVLIGASGISIIAGGAWHRSAPLNYDNCPKI